MRQTSIRLIKFHLTLWLCIYLQGVWAQSSNSPLVLGLHVHRGIVLNHSPRSGQKGLSLQTIHGVELGLDVQTRGQKVWHKTFGYPRWGSSLLLYDLGQDKLGGTCWGVLIHTTVFLVKRPYFLLSLRLGSGLGGVSKPFDSEDNVKNLYISAPVNTSMHGQVEAQLPLGKGYFWTLAGSFTHFSNGSTRMPNLGINLPTWNTGIRYVLSASPLPRYDLPSESHRAHRVYMALGGFFKVPPVFDSSGSAASTFATYTLQVHYQRRFGALYSMMGGLDASQDNSLSQDPEVQSGTGSIRRLGLFMGNELHLGSLSLLAGLGRYVYNRSKREDWANEMYIRTGLRYRWQRHWMSGFHLKTHWGQADTFELITAYIF